MIAATLGLAALGAALFRMRGSDAFHNVTGRGKTTADAVYALALAGAAWGASEVVGDAWVDYWEAGLLAVALWLGGRPGWWGSIDMGTVEGSLAMDFILQTARGVIWTLPAAVVISYGAGVPWTTGWPLVVAGLLCGVLYLLGYWIPSTTPGLLQGTEIGEVLFGGAIGTALGLSVLGV